MKTKGVPEESALRRMVEGVRLEDGPAKALSAEIHEKAETNTWIKIVVGEGRFHLVKRLCESVGLPVLRLYRPEFGGITVARLRPGHWRELTDDEVQIMRAAVGMEGGEPGRTALAQELPKAGRRHGHGPPPQAATHAGTRRPGHAGDRRDQEENDAPRGKPGRSQPSRRADRPAQPGRPAQAVRTARKKGRSGPVGRRAPSGPAGRSGQVARDVLPGVAGRSARFRLRRARSAREIVPPMARRRVLSALLAAALAAGCASRTDLESPDPHRRARRCGGSGGVRRSRRCRRCCWPRPTGAWRSGWPRPRPS